MFWLCVVCSATVSPAVNVLLLQAPRVVSVNVFPTTQRVFRSGSAIFIEFDAPTSSSRLSSSSLRLSPAQLSRNRFFSVWVSDRRLAIYFPYVSAQDEEEHVLWKDVTLQFLPPQGQC